MSSLTPERLRAVVEQYAARLSAGDVEGIVALFAPDGVMEDPIGSPVKVGHRAIREFFAQSIEFAHPQMSIPGSVAVVPDAAAAAMAYRVESTIGDDTIVVEGIDTFHFDADGLIVSMQAFFGPSNITMTATEPPTA